MRKVWKLSTNLKLLIGAAKVEEKDYGSVRRGAIGKQPLTHPCSLNYSLLQYIM